MKKKNTRIFGFDLFGFVCFLFYIGLTVGAASIVWVMARGYGAPFWIRVIDSLSIILIIWGFVVWYSSIWE